MKRTSAVGRPFSASSRSGGTITTRGWVSSSTVTVTLDTEPTAPVVLGVASQDPTECLAATASVTLDGGNWQTGASFQVSAVPDDTVDGDQVCVVSITADLTTSDLSYRGLDPDDATFTVVDDGVPVELVGVRIELPSNQPIVLLKEVAGTRYLPIWIGAGEATAIAFALEGVQPPRPLTHDLLKLTLEALDASVEKVVVTEMRDGIFYADLVLSRGGDEVVVSSRPSDAIALAARTGAPLFVSPPVLEDSGVEIHDEEEEDEVARFRNFLDSVKPEDFESA